MEPSWPWRSILSPEKAKNRLQTVIDASHMDLPFLFFHKTREAKKTNGSRATAKASNKGQKRNRGKKNPMTLFFLSWIRSLAMDGIMICLPISLGRLRQRSPLCPIGPGPRFWVWGGRSRQILVFQISFEACF